MSTLPLIRGAQQQKRMGFYINPVEGVKGGVEFENREVVVKVCVSLFEGNDVALNLKRKQPESEDTELGDI